MSEQVINLNERELGKKPITSLFMKYSLITLLGMLAQAVMVMFEGIIIGNGLGTSGLATVSFIMPLENLNLALGGFFGASFSIVVGIYLGKEDKENARKVFAQGFWLTVIVSVLLATLIFYKAESIAVLLGATGDLLEPTTLFVKIFMVGYPFCITGQMLTYMCRIDEKPGIATMAMTFAAAFGVFILYYTVMVLQMGIAGAAIYYSVSIGLFSLCIFYFLFSKNTIFKIYLSDLKIDFVSMGRALKVGLPYFIVQASTFVYGIVINNYLASVGTETDIAAFAIINGYVIYIFMMLATSFTNGLQTIVSYNKGAESSLRLKQALKVSIVSNVGVLAILTIPMIIFARQIIGLFAGEGEALIDSASTYTRIVVILTSLGFVSLIVSGYFQAVEKEAVATVLGICRYVIFAIPLIIVLAKEYGIMGIWYSQPVADVLAFILSMVFVIHEIKRLRKGVE